MIDTWLGTTATELWLVVVSTTFILVVAIAVIRASGLRALSKMSSFDFIVTLALGSTVATVAVTPASVWAGAAASASLLGLQWVVAKLRRRTGVDHIVDNRPKLLMVGPDMIEENLRATRVTHDDVVARLREANVTRLDRVLAVVMETTGDISVLHGDGPLDDALLRGVVRRGAR